MEDENIFQSALNLYTTVIPQHLRIPVRSIIRSPYVTIVYIHDQSVLGFMFLIQSRYSTHIDYIGVSPESQGMGIGKKLLEVIRSPIITLECEPGLVTYYQKRGFKEVSRYIWHSTCMVFMKYGRAPIYTSVSDDMILMPTISDINLSSPHPQLPVSVIYIEIFFKKRIS